MEAETLPVSRSVGSIGIGNGICVVLAHMQSHDLTRFRIHSEDSLVVDEIGRAHV